MKFKQITHDLYGAKKAGYCLDENADRIIDASVAATIGFKRTDTCLDSFYDFDGDLYEDEDGKPYAVMMVFADGKYQPLCWQKLRPANYRIKPEFLDKWDGGPDDIVYGQFVEMIARGWEIPFGEVLDQLELIPAAKISIDNGHTFVSPEKALESVDFETMVEYMDERIAGTVHDKFAPCDDLEFLVEYLKRATENLIIG